jgi:Lamin Tail Domain
VSQYRSRSTCVFCTTGEITYQFAFALLAVSLTVSAASISPGDLIITEVMANPAAVSDANGKWFEIRNLTGNSLNLNGLTLSDNGSDFHIIDIGPLMLNPFDYFVFGRSGDSRNV